MSGVDSTPTLRQVLADRGAATVLVTVFLSTSVSVMQVTALGVLVYDMTGSELALGLLGLAEFLPAFALVLVTGSVADRFDRRKVVAAGLSVEVACSVALAWYASTDPTSTTPIFATVLVFGVGRAFVAPAARALPADVVAPAALPRLIALSSVSWQTALIGAPVVAGFLYAGSPPWPFLASGIVAGAAMVSVSLIRLLPGLGGRRADAARPTMHTALEGLRFIRRTPILLGAISLDLFAVLFGGAVALLPAIAEDRLGVDAVGLGWLRASIGLGAAAMGAYLVLRPLHRHVGRTLFVVVTLFGLFTVVLGLTRSFAIAFFALFVLSGADAVSVFIRSTLVPLVTPDESRGRVLAVEHVFIGASNELGAAESGIAGQLLGVSGAVVLGGVATMVVAAIWAVLFPMLRRVDRFTDVVPVSEPPTAAPPPQGLDATGAATAMPPG